MNTETFLDDREKAEVQRFLENDILKNAVKKIFLFGIYGNGTLEAGKDPEPSQNFALSLIWDASGRELSQTNEQLGERLRASAEGIRFLETGFALLDKFKAAPKVKEEKKNPAR